MTKRLHFLVRKSGKVLTACGAEHRTIAATTLNSTEDRTLVTCRGCLRTAEYAGERMRA